MTPEALWLGSTAATVLAAAVVVWRLRPEPPPPGDGRTFRLKRAVAVIGWGLAAGGVALLWLTVWIGETPSVLDGIAVALLAVTLAAYGLSMVLRQRRSWIHADRSGLTVRRVRGRPVRLAWGEVERVRFSTTRGGFVFEGRGERIVASVDLVGFDDLTRLVSTRLAGRGGKKAARLGR